MGTTLYIGLDDTDTREKPGTGRLARNIAAALAENYSVLAVTRHQLFFDPRVPMTSKNSANVIHLAPAAADASFNIASLAGTVAGLMQAQFQPGSDPGLCVAVNPPAPITEFGRRAKVDLVTAAEAHQLANRHTLHLQALGGDGGGVIGALAGVGLAASGDDGRFVQVGQVRDLHGQQPLEAILAAGVDRVQNGGWSGNHHRVDRN